VVQLALSKYPNERQQSARELIDAFGRALGQDFWDATFPVGWEQPAEEFAEEIPDPPQLDLEATAPADPYRIMHAFEAFMPERLAAAKLRGFVDDFHGQVLTSEPGLIRMRLGVPEGYKEAKEGSGIFRWFAARRPTVPRGQEPVELELQMEKPDPNQPRLFVIVSFHPMKEYPPQDCRSWQERCERLNNALRQYLGAQ
jgi:hypothetical protein